MSAWDSVLEQLASCEKARFSAERAGQQGVRHAEAKIAAVTERLAEVQEEHEKQMAAVLAQNEEQLLDVMVRAERECAVAQEGTKIADDRIQKAEERGLAAINRGRELEKQVRKMCATIDQMEQNCVRRNAETHKAVDSKVEMVLKSANHRVNDLSQLAVEVQQAALDSMDMMQIKHKETVLRSDTRTESRSRFQEVCALSKMRTDQKMSHHDYEGAKRDLMDSWFKQWSPVPGSTATPNSGGRFFSPLGAQSPHSEDYFMRGYAGPSRPDTAPPDMIH